MVVRACYREKRAASFMWTTMCARGGGPLLPSGQLREPPPFLRLLPQGRVYSPVYPGLHPDHHRRAVQAAGTEVNLRMPSERSKPWKLISAALTMCPYKMMNPRSRNAPGANFLKGITASGALGCGGRMELRSPGYSADRASVSATSVTSGCSCKTEAGTWGVTGP